ncbi:MAG TPA: carbohydrate kinase family protein [Methylomirabilota bacterium]|jgi:sugar/nucleoside kinase (ribokinase family)|nr:carbohydrate kinase family protein [Methylomirabilota bacterium]
MSALRPLEVIVVGDLFADLVMSGFPSWPPRAGEELFAERFCREIGGGAAITACGLAKLGAKVGVVGVVGETDGQWLVEGLETRGVNTAAIHRSSREPTAVTVSISSPTDRTFLTYMGANRELPAILQQIASRGEFAKARHVHLAFAPEPAEAGNLFRELIAQGCTLSVDVGWHPEWLSNRDCMEALRNVNIFFPNEREATIVTGETEPRRILQAFEKMRFRAVALKLGQAGAGLMCDGTITFCEPITVQSVDTTGAGDCFDAGFLYGWLRGDNPQSCLKAGTVCGALSTRCLGGIDGFPTVAEMDAHI